MAGSVTAKHAETEALCIRTGDSVEEMRQAISDNLICVQGRFAPVATQNDYYLAVAYTIRDRIFAQWAKTAHTYFARESRTVCYLSAEFLLGPHLENHLINLGLYDNVKQAVKALGLDLQELIEQEAEPGLGNGGLGRLAACYLDSLATLNIPTIGYGIRYEFGIFTQEIRDGWQEEIADQWLRMGNPRCFLDEIRRDFPGDEGLVRRLSLIDEGGEKSVRMANLACVGSRRINGVARLHTELLREQVLNDFNRISPEKFLNVTNGVTPRRFVVLSNPALASLISECIGTGWIRDLFCLRELEPFAEDAAFRERWRAINRQSKEFLTKIVVDRTGIAVDPDSLFDVQVKRIHEYKRQHLNVARMGKFSSDRAVREYCENIWRVNPVVID